MNDLEAKGKSGIERGYFDCTRDKSEIGIQRCVEFQEEGVCSCQLGRLIRDMREEREKRFGFAPQFKKSKSPKNAKITEIAPEEICFIPSDNTRFHKDHIVVYETSYGYFSYDPRVNTEEESITVYLLQRNHEQSKRIMSDLMKLEYRELPLKEILPLPHHTRKNSLKDLEDLVESIKQKGVIEPIIVRQVGIGEKRWEVICGERRCFAAARAGLKAVPARVVKADDIEARLIYLDENLQRKDLTPTERTELITDYLDASLLTNPDVGGEYEKLGDSPFDRVKFVLGKLDSDRRNNTDYFTHKFVGKIENAFKKLSRPIDWRTFYIHDLPLISNIDPEVKEISLEAKLSGSQTRELDKVKKAAPEAYEKIKETVKKSPRKLTANKIREIRIRELSSKKMTNRQSGEQSNEGFSRSEQSLVRVKNALQTAATHGQGKETQKGREVFEEASALLKKAAKGIKEGFFLLQEGFKHTDPALMIESAEKLTGQVLELSEFVGAECYRLLTKLALNGEEAALKESAWAETFIESWKNGKHRRSLKIN